MLIKSGVQLGDYVGIFMKRSIDTVVSMVAILKAGAAYVPLIQNYPEVKNSPASSKIILISLIVVIALVASLKHELLS